MVPETRCEDSKTISHVDTDAGAISKGSYHGNNFARREIDVAIFRVSRGVSDNNGITSHSERASRVNGTALATNGIAADGSSADVEGARVVHAPTISCLTARNNAAIDFKRSSIVDNASVVDGFTCRNVSAFNVKCCATFDVEGAARIDSVTDDGSSSRIALYDKGFARHMDMVTFAIKCVAVQVYDVSLAAFEFTVEVDVSHQCDSINGTVAQSSLQFSFITDIGRHLRPSHRRERKEKDK